jgi:hypothetical protein
VSFPSGISLTEHWNGISWQVVKSPNANKKDVNPLNALAAVPGSETLWTVGETAPGIVINGQSQAAFLIEEWTGQSWQAVPRLVAAGTQGNLYGVAVTPTGDVWVVGGAGLTMVHMGPVTRASLGCATPTATPTSVPTPTTSPMSTP